MLVCELPTCRRAPVPPEQRQRRIPALGIPALFRGLTAQQFAQMSWRQSRMRDGS
jgi:hypothetical protein